LVQGTGASLRPESSGALLRTFVSLMGEAALTQAAWQAFLDRADHARRGRR
jgi:hypothetical protein